MATKTKRAKRTTSARKTPTRSTAAAAKVPVSPFRLRDDEIEKLLLSGEKQAQLVQYFGEEQYEYLRDLATKASKRSVRGADRVLILPGIMGSKLGQRRTLWDDVIWLDPIDIAFGNLKQLKLGVRRIEALGVLLFCYLKLKFTLRAAGFDADFHPYDWRKSAVELGQELKARVDSERAPKVHLVAHSMGGIVSRAAIKLGMPKLGRFVMLGTPNRGSFNPAMLVRGTYPILQKLAMLDVKASAEELAREVFIDFPSVYELMPAPGTAASLDLLDPDSWPKTGLKPNAAQMRKARTLQDALAKSDGERFFLIAGVNQSTVTNIRLQGDEFVYESTPDGDGTVPLALCQLENTRTYYVEAEHGSLPNNDAVGAAVCEILRNGAATSLPEERPAVRGGVRKSMTDSECREVERQMKRSTRGQKLPLREARSILSEVAAPIEPPSAPAAAPEFVKDYVVPFQRVVVGRRRQHRIDVELALGSITETSAQATVLGIFPDVAPKGAAGAMDERLNGAISEATNRRMFSGQVGELFTLPTGRSGLKTDFVVFAGLGSFGSFSPGVLETVSENVIRTLIRSYVSDFATVLIGGGSGSDIELVLVHMIRGFVRGLLDVDDSQHFRRIMLCEADPERYESMRQTLFRLAGTKLFDEVEVTITEQVLPPAPPPTRRPPAVVELQPIYLTLTTSESPVKAATGGKVPPAEFVFRASLLGVANKATVIVDEKGVASPSVTALLSRIENLNPQTVDKYGDDLASTLMPAKVREALGDMPKDHPLVLIHDRESSRFPWELMRIEGDYPAVNRGMHRRYLANDLSVAKWLEERRRDDTLSMLLVVNPTQDLDGAEEEAERIGELFGAASGVHIQTRRHEQATRKRLLADFSSGTFDVIHYAGHAYFDPRAPAKSGIVCSGDEILSGADLAGLSNLPSLVFFNACEAGRIRGRRRQPAPPRRTQVRVPSSKAEKLTTSVGFAEAFLRGGIANYIGTYWPVGDAAAKVFATKFYTEVLKPGTTIGAALRAARTEVRGIKGTIDWADYIHYGNQSFVLKEGR